MKLGTETNSLVNHIMTSATLEAISKLSRIEGAIGMVGDMECIVGDIADEETVFKTMSDHGQKDNMFAERIEQLFELKGIKFSKGLQKRVFVVKNSELMKL